jgi:hypothetical protein
MSALQIALVAALVIFMIARRFAGAPVGVQSLIVPIGMSVYGFVTVRDATHHGLHTIDIALLAAEIVVGIGAGLARGATIRLYLRDGHLWQRYTVATLLVWIAMIAVRIGFAIGGDSLGATLPAGGTALVSFGVSMLVETLVVSKRAMATGAPIRPRPSRRDRRAMTPR